MSPRAPRSPREERELALPTKSEVKAITRSVNATGVLEKSLFIFFAKSKLLVGAVFLLPIVLTALPPAFICP